MRTGPEFREDVKNFEDDGCSNPELLAYVAIVPSFVYTAEMSRRKDVQMRGAIIPRGSSRSQRKDSSWATEPTRRMHHST